VEDHPLDYYDFEGVIPAGEYGGGDVVVWDWGTWDLDEADDALAAVDAGDLHFDLHGEKLRGRFVLVRTKRGAAKDWLLLHKHDDDAVPGWDPEQFPRSVKSGRTNDEVKDAPAASWSSGANWAPPTSDELDALDALGTSGTWEPVRADDPAAAVAGGEIHVDPYGEKLRGRFVLVRPKRGNGKDWLLLHKHDDDAVTGWNPEDYPRSVKSRRTNDEV